VNRSITPEATGGPSANYALAVASDPGRMLHTSGIGPVEPDGSVPATMERQTEAVWSTLLALLDGAEMEVADVVSVTTYVVVPEPSHESLSARLHTAMAARDRALDGHRCASVLVPVPALATPSWKLEIALVAARS